MGHVAVEGGQVVSTELAETSVPTRTNQHRHQLRARGQELVKSLCGQFHRQPRAQLRFLGRNTDRAVVRRARPHADAPDRLHRRIGHRDRIRAKCQRLGEVGVGPQPAGDHERDVPAPTGVEMTPRPGQGGNGGHGDMVPKHDRRRTGIATSAVELETPV